MSASPIERMIDAADLRCTICGARRGGCSCWERCNCGWSFTRGDQCRNPIHAVTEAAETLAANVAAEIDRHMASAYLNIEAAARPAFRRVLRATILANVRETLVTWMMADKQVREEPRQIMLSGKLPLADT